MSTVKTAISIGKDLFEKVDQLAEKLDIPRSQVFVRAVDEFIQRHENRRILDALNDVYADEPDADDEALRAARRRHHKRIVEGEW